MGAQKAAHRNEAGQILAADRQRLRRHAVARRLGKNPRPRPGTPPLPCGRAQSSRRLRSGCGSPARPSRARLRYARFSCAGELDPVQARVDTFLGQQFGVRAQFDQTAALQHRNPIGAFDCRQAVGNDDGGAVLHQRLERGLDCALRFRIQRRSRLVENQYRRVLEDGPCDRDALPLPTRELDPSLSPTRVSKPFGIARMKSSACAARAARSTSARLASLIAPYAMLAATVSLNRTTSWLTIARSQRLHRPVTSWKMISSTLMRPPLGV